jgi:hypothetical protein
LSTVDDAPELPLVLVSKPLGARALAAIREGAFRP